MPDIPISGLISIWMNIFEYGHWELGLPVWMGAAISAFIYRIFIIPFSVMSIKEAQKLNSIKDIHVMKYNYWNSVSQFDRKSRIEFNQKMREIYKEHKIKRYKIYSPLIMSIPGFITFSFSLRVSSCVIPDVAESGFLWFQDMTLHDPELKLVSLLAIFHLLNYYYNSKGFFSSSLVNVKIFFFNCFC